MLVLRRSEGDWVEVTHRSGDVLRFRVYDICREAIGGVHLAFDDSARNFDIQRTERKRPGQDSTGPAAQPNLPSK
jgi:hypothetical protein